MAKNVENVTIVYASILLIFPINIAMYNQNHYKAHKRDTSTHVNKLIVFYYQLWEWKKNISNNNNSVRVINCRVCAACLTRDVFLVFLFVGLSLHCFHNLSGAARCQKTHALIINITKNANIYFSDEIFARVFVYSSHPGHSVWPSGCKTWWWEQWRWPWWKWSTWR